jgi:hypothetical protein
MKRLLFISIDKMSYIELNNFINESKFSLAYSFTEDINVIKKDVKDEVEKLVENL